MNTDVVCTGYERVVVKFKYDREAVRGLKLPDGRSLRFPHPSPSSCITAGLWLLAKEGTDSSDEVRIELISACDLALSADNASDQVDDLVRLLRLTTKLRAQLATDVEPSNDIVALVFAGLEQTLNLPYWWAFALGGEALQRLAAVAVAGLAEIYAGEQPNQAKLLDGCVFVANQGGTHYRDRAAYEVRLRAMGIEV